MDDYSMEMEWDLEYDFTQELDEDLYNLLENFNEYDDYVE